MTQEIEVTGAVVHEIPKTIFDWLQLLTNILESLPPEYRRDANLRINTHDGDGVSDLEFVYTRPETDKEKADREASARRWEAEREARERSEYERLLKKFGPK